MSYIVREPQPVDIDRIVALGKSVHSETIYAHLTYDEDKVANLVAGAILKQPPLWSRVIALDYMIVGGIIASYESALCSNEVVTRDQVLAIHKDHRGRCFRQLVQMIDEYRQWAISQNAKLIILGASSGVQIESVSKLFTRLGFERTGVLHTIRS